MLFAVASLFLATILMTQANTIESDVTFIEPLSEELFIFDVISDATPAELKGSVKSAGVEIRHSFQVLGTRQYLFDDTSTSQFKSIMQTTARTYQGADEKVKPVLYAVVGRYPAKIFFFGNVDENAAQKAVLDGLDAAGGPGNNVINCLRLRKV